MQSADTRRSLLKWVLTLDHSLEQPILEVNISYRAAASTSKLANNAGEMSGEMISSQNRL